jgi:hypothetical protein
MGLFNRQVKKKSTNGDGIPKNGQGNGHDAGAPDTNGHGEPAQANGETGAELFDIKTRQTMPERLMGFAREKSPHAIKELIPWLENARSSSEGRAELVEKTKEVAWQQADNTVRAVTAGMGIADTRAFFRGDPAIEKPNPRYKIHVNAFFAHIRPKYYEKSYRRNLDGVLHSVRPARLRRHRKNHERGPVWTIDARPAPRGRRIDGAHCCLAHDARLFNGLLQAAPDFYLAYGGRPANLDLRPVL